MIFWIKSCTNTSKSGKTLMIAVTGGDREKVGPLVRILNAYEKLDDHEVAAHIVEVLVALERPDDALEVLEDAETRHTDSELLQDVRDRLFPDAD